MSQLVEIKVPDIGDYKDVPVIEVHVQPGDQIEVDQSLVTLESDKATMDVPAPAAGTVREVKLKVGDSTAEGATILLLEPRATATKQASIQAPRYWNWTSVNASRNFIGSASSGIASA